MADSARPVIGLVLRDDSDNSDTAYGAVIAVAVPPASGAGLRRGDRVVSVDDVVVSSAADLRIDLVLPSGDHFLLAIIKFSDETGDQTACWVLVPKSDTTVGDHDVGHETSVWSSLVDDANPTLDNTNVDGV